MKAGRKRQFHRIKKPGGTTAGAAAGAADPVKGKTGRSITTQEDEIRAWATNYAAKNGWVLNPEKDVLDRVIKGLVRNEQRFGHRYCPCRLRSGDAEKDNAIICPCIYHKDEIAKDGHCHCMLYYLPAEGQPGTKLT